MADVTETRQDRAGMRVAPPTPGVVQVFSETTGAGLIGFELARLSRIGRDKEAEVSIDDTQISRFHALLAPSTGGVIVTDLGSRNGTYLDGRRLGSEEVLAPTGSVLRCGGTLLRVVDDVGPYRAWTAQPGSRLIGGPSLGIVRKLLKNIARLRHAVLIEGETGTGKEVVARELHELSAIEGQYIAVNCSAIPAELVESELFGHSRGAFSGSDRQRPGLFRTAHRGTLLLDELGDLPASAQAKLLRAMELREIRPVGEDRAVPVDVRVIGATNVDLARRVEEGLFRADLFHRIAVWKIHLPPLRARLEDVPLLAVHLLGDSGLTLGVELMEKFMLSSWPGNVRELRNAVTTAMAEAEANGQTQLRPEHLPPRRAGEALAQPAAGDDPETAARRSKLEAALTRHQGNVSHVAKEMGCTRPWLYLEMKRLNLDPTLYRRRG
ncbi:MAG: sigma 54-interacting transcriptional regulator [Deltaproteobacteria bacterium]|nr:sigma 54-interacting transcriptional regulator [Deltaproteobacteria bacterium]